MKFRLSFVCLTLLLGSILKGQDKISFGGYLSDMQSLYHLTDNWIWENTLHNRLNLELYPTSWLSGSIQVRNRVMFGNTFNTFPGYAEQIGADQGWIDMNWTSAGELGEENGYLLSTAIDRLWLQFSLGNLEIKAGRQRINWGQTFVWNPNDIFNSYSYFEVDYPERPGSDALRVSYYTGNSSTIELAANIDSANRYTAAAYYRFNTLNFDVQVLGGVYRNEDLFLGAGWSGNLSSAALRGELSYFRDLDHFSDTTGYLMASLGLDYTFPSSLWLQTEVLYSGFAKEMDMTSMLELYSGSLDVKSLGFTTWAWFGSASYPVSPLLNASFAAIWYPEWKGAYLGPTLDLSLGANMDLSLIFQYFTSKIELPGIEPERENSIFGFLRLKWSF